MNSGDKADPWERPPGQLGRFRFSTDDIPEKDRFAIVNEVMAKRTRRQHLPFSAEGPYYIHGESSVLPGMVVYRSSCSPVRIVRSRDLLSDGNDNLVFSWVNQPRATRYRNHEINPAAGEATLVYASEEAAAVFPKAVKHVAIMVPRNTLAPLLRDANSCLFRPLPAATPALHLLLRYLDIVYDENAVSTRVLQDAAVAHMCDLLGIMFGATRDGAELARTRGVRAARLHVLQNHVRENLTNPGLSVSQIADQYRLTPRYVQMLFGDSGTTFTEFLRNERLARAYQMLSSPRWHGRKVVEIAFACGFSDLSHFNHAFRARFGATPSDIRANPDSAALPAPPRT